MSVNLPAQVGLTQQVTGQTEQTVVHEQPPRPSHQPAQQGMAPTLPPARSRSPFGRGFTASLGVLLALALALAVAILAGVVFSIFAAFFVALGLNPLVKMLQRRGLPRGRAIAAVALGFVLFVVLLLWLIIPFALREGAELIQSLPTRLTALSEQPWVATLNSLSNGAVDAAIGSLAAVTSQPSFWVVIGGGVLNLVVSVAGAVSSGIFIAVLTLYFLVSLEPIKKGFYALIPASKRHTSIYLTEKITDSVGKYLSGMVILAAFNAVYSYVLLTVTGVRFAAAISLAAFFITLIPLIGTVLTTFFMTICAVLSSPTAGLIVLIAMLVYMQIEAYILTPKVMSKAVQVPGALVLISATAGGTLLGLPGALIAIPVAAGCSLIIRYVVIPQRRMQ